MNQCNICGKPEQRDNTYSTDEICGCKKQLQAENDRLRKLFNKVKPYADYCDGFDMFMGGISLGNILKQALKEVK